MVGVKFGDNTFEKASNTILVRFIGLSSILLTSR